jgi:hypothetical protein
VRVLTVGRRGGREVGRRKRLYGIGGDRLCLDRYLVVLWCKPRALAGSLGLRQAIDEGGFPVSYVELHRGLWSRPSASMRKCRLWAVCPTPEQATRRGHVGRAAPGAGQAAASGRLPAADMRGASAGEIAEKLRREQRCRPDWRSFQRRGPREEKGERGPESAPGRRRLKGQLRSILSIPGHLRVAFACRLGYPAGEARPYLRVCRPLGRFVHRNVYAEHRGGLEAPAPD